MAQITLRLSDDLRDRIDGTTDEETTRSEWLREAARARLIEEKNDDLSRRLDRLEERVTRLERPFWEQYL